jgi:hypothetical protein
MLRPQEALLEVERRQRLFQLEEATEEVEELTARKKLPTIAKVHLVLPGYRQIIVNTITKQ